MAASFHWLDYLLCSISLIISLSVGIFYGVKGYKNREQKTDEFLLGGRNLNVLPVSVSLFVSYLSAITFIGDPVEVYYHGAVYMFIGVGYCLSMIPAAHIFAPAFNRMKITSAYEYLNTRYNHAVQMFVSTVNIISGTLYLGIVIYAPSVALSQVTGLKEWISILLIGSVGTIYTVLGGIRAVIWADAVQSVIMLTGLIVILIQGLVSVGGFYKMWEIADRGNRLNFLKDSWSPFVRSTILGYIVGGFFRTFVPYTSVQAWVQRYCTLSSPKQAKIAVYLNIPMFALFVVIFTLIGLTMFAYYDGCDPLQSGRINRPDQITPLFMLDMLGFLPGVPGIFLASVFAASLSTLSSIINASAANILKDFIEPMYIKHKGTALSDSLTTAIAKITTVFFGVLTTFIAIITLYIKVNIFPISIKITGTFSGPMAAMFLCGMCCYFVKTWSMLIASATSLAICLWLGIGAFFYPSPSEALITLTDKCNNFTLLDHNNTMDITTVAETVNVTNITGIDAGMDLVVSDLYTLSPLLYNPLGYTIAFVLAVMLSALQMCCVHLFCKQKKEKRHLNSDRKCPENIPLKC